MCTEAKTRSAVSVSTLITTFDFELGFTVISEKCGWSLK